MNESELYTEILATLDERRGKVAKNAISNRFLATVLSSQVSDFYRQLFVEKVLGDEPDWLSPTVRGGG